MLQLTPSRPRKCWTRQPETPWQWRADNPPNHSEKMLNVSSEILCNSSQTCARHVLELTPSGPPKHWTRQPETPWQWRTDKPLNHIEKLANVSSEILQNNSQTCARHVLQLTPSEPPKRWTRQKVARGTNSSSMARSPLLGRGRRISQF